MSTATVTLLVRSGLAANVAATAAAATNGEMLWATDTHVLYVCQGGVAYNVGGGGSGMAIGGAVTSGTATYVLYVDGSGDLGQSADFTWDVSTKTLTVTDGTRTAVLAGGTRAAQFTDGTNTVSVCDGSNAVAASQGSYSGYLCPSGGPAVYGTDGTRVSQISDGTNGLNLTDGTRTVLLCAAGYAGHFVNGAVVVEICNGTDAITYTPGVLIDWSGTPPTDVWLALDRIVAWVLANTGTGAWVTTQPNP